MGKRLRRQVRATGKPLPCRKRRARWALEGGGRSARWKKKTKKRDGDRQKKEAEGEGEGGDDRHKLAYLHMQKCKTITFPVPQSTARRG